MDGGEIQIKVVYFRPGTKDDADADRIMDLTYSDELSMDELADAFEVMCNFLGFDAPSVAQAMADCDNCEVLEEMRKDMEGADKNTAQLDLEAEKLRGEIRQLKGTVENNTTVINYWYDRCQDLLKRVRDLENRLAARSETPAPGAKKNWYEPPGER